MPTMTSEDKKPVLEAPQKSSMEILSELFSTFDSEPPLIIKKEKNDEASKKPKKSKKKHKHKEKKHKKKKKKRKKDDSYGSDTNEVNLKDILIKQESTDIKTESPNGSVKNGGVEKNGKEKSKIFVNDLTTIFKSTIQEIQEKVGMVNDDVDDRYQRKRKHKSSECTMQDNGKKLLSGKEDGEMSDRSNDDDNEKEVKSKHKKRKKHKNSEDDGEDENAKSKSKKRKHKHSDSSKKHRHSHSRSRSRSMDSHKRHKEDKHRAKDDGKDHHKRHHSGERDKDHYKSSYREKERDKSRDRHKRHGSKDRYENGFDDRKSRRDSYKDRDYEEGRTDWFGRDRHRGYDDRRRYRSWDKSPLRDDNSHIDKKKLLEIARKNAIQMMKSGSLPAALTLGPQAQEKVIAAIKAGGKTIEELTDFCKTLSKKEELGDLSSLSDKGNSSDSDADKPFHHPFQIKDRPTSITMNIKNSVPLPIKTTQERTSELRMQFPVSSGQQHRKTEGEWVPVSPKKPEPKAPPPPASTTSNSTLLAIEEAPQPVVVPALPNAPPGPQAFPTPILELSVDIGSIVSQRLTAMRRLQENPNDVQALSQMYKSNKEMQTWAQSKQQPGQFTGSTGAQILSQAELASGYQAWAKKDQLQTAAPVSGGMGMHLLQKMGWKPGEGLGKEKSGTLEPLLLQVKLDKKGLVANEEQQKKKKQLKGGQTVKTLQGKHPVSLLGEYASKRKLGAPQYSLCFECGPDHKKNFLFKVILDGIEYKPNVASANKKDAKAAAATLCLQNIGLLPS